MSNIAEHLSDEVASTTCWVVANGVAVTLWPPRRTDASLA